MRKHVQQETFDTTADSTENSQQEANKKANKNRKKKRVHSSVVIGSPSNVQNPEDYVNQHQQLLLQYGAMKSEKRTQQNVGSPYLADIHEESPKNSIHSSQTQVVKINSPGNFIDSPTYGQKFQGNGHSIRSKFGVNRSGSMEKAADDEGSSQGNRNSNNKKYNRKKYHFKTTTFLPQQFSKSLNDSNIKRQRYDARGIPIHQGGKRHQIQFKPVQEIEEVHEVENWKEYNVIFDEEYSSDSKKNCCTLI